MADVRGRRVENTSIFRACVSDSRRALREHFPTLVVHCSKGRDQSGFVRSGPTLGVISNTCWRCWPMLGRPRPRPGYSGRSTGGIGQFRANLVRFAASLSDFDEDPPASRPPARPPSGPTDRPTDRTTDRNPARPDLALVRGGGSPCVGRASQYPRVGTVISPVGDRGT